MVYRSALLLVLALLGLSLARPLSAEGGELDLADYERLLREARAAATRGDRLDLEQVAPTLISARSVLMPAGDLAPVDNRWLADELARPEPDLSLIAARLGALIDALALPAPPAPAAAQARLKAILAAPPFADPNAQPREPSAFERWWQQVIDAFINWLIERLGPLGQPVAEAAQGAPGTLAAWSLTALALLLIAAVLVVWLRGVRHNLRPEASLAGPLELAARDTADARAQAAALATSGDYRSALRMLTLAALLWLDERHTLPYRAHQTNREHLARLRERPILYEHLAPIVETTDRVWYGGAPLDASGYAALERQVEALSDVTAEGRNALP